MPVQSWLDQPVQKIAQQLAEECVARQLLKQADLRSTLSGWGQQAQSLGKNVLQQTQSLGNSGLQAVHKLPYTPQAMGKGRELLAWLKAPEQAAVRAGLLGAGIGGLAGAGSSLLRRKEERQPLRNTLTGLLAGGAVGLGGGLLSKQLAKSQGSVAGSPAAKTETSLADVNRQLADVAQQSQQRYTKEMTRGALQGLGIGTAVGAGFHARANMPHRLLQRGATDLLKSPEAPTSPAAVETLGQLGRNPTAFQFERAVRHAASPPPVVSQQPTMVPNGEVLPAGRVDAANLRDLLYSSHAGERQPIRPGFREVFDASPAARSRAPNPHLPGLNNADVRGIMRRGYRPVTRTALGPALIPLIWSLISAHRRGQEGATQ